MENETWQEQTAEPAFVKPKKKRRWLWILAALVLALALSTALHMLNFPAIFVEETENGFVLYLGDAAREKEQQVAALQNLPEPAGKMQAQTGGQQSLQVQPSRPSAENEMQSGAMSLQDIYESVLPSVVTIVTRTYGGSSLGTGVIMSDDGYILTNQHVIENAAAISVQLSDDTVYTAALVGGDVASDLAVLKIGAEGLVPANFGDSNSLRVGDPVAAIGNPLDTGLRGTMTDGIISGISRDLTVGGRKMTLLQTNAALNNGSSGGPLINCYGQVVGINAVKLTGSYGLGAVEGLGFAIPISTVKPIVDDLIAKGYVVGRPAIGIVTEELPLRARLFYGLPEGAYVTQVDPNSDAAKKGLRAGDIITAINGQAVSGPASLSTLRDEFKAGDTVKLTLFREGGTLEKDVILMDRVTGES